MGTYGWPRQVQRAAPGVPAAPARQAAPGRPAVRARAGSAAPIVGLDGVMGFPGYSGYVPNTLLSNSLVLGRDLLLSGSASKAFDEPAFDEKKLLLSNDQSKRFFDLQPSVRAALLDMELMQSLEVDGPDPVRLTYNKSAFVTLNRPKKDVVAKQLALVQSFSDLRFERTSEILAQVVPQTAAWSAIAGLTPERHRYTLELLGAGLRFATNTCQRIKWQLSVPRPVELNPTIQPMILTPGFSAFPSGHATEAFFAAELLHLLMTPTKADAPTDNVMEKENTASLRCQLLRLAYRVSENRVVAGLHYPMDSIAGQALGIALARFFVFRAGIALDYPAVSRQTAHSGTQRQCWIARCAHPNSTGLQVRPWSAKPTASALLSLLWVRASLE